MASIVSLYHTSILVCFIFDVLFWSGVYLLKVAKSCLTLTPHGLQRARLLCPSPSPGICWNSCQLTWWCYSIISFSFCLQSFPESESLPVSKLFVSGGQRLGASASPSVLPKYFQGCFLLRVTGVISLLSKWLSRVFSSSTIKKH